MRSVRLALAFCGVSGVGASALACSNLVCLPSVGCGDMIQRSLAAPPRAALQNQAAYTAGAFNSWNVTFQSQLPLAQIGGGSKGSSLYGWVDPLTQREYAIMGRSNGTAFVDITNPRQPKYVANLPMAAGSVATDWREPKVYGNYAFVGVDNTNHPIQIVDLTKLRAYSGTPLQLAADRNFRGNGNTLTKAHTLAINPQSGFLYAARTDKYSGGIMAIDVRNPLNAFEAGGYSGDGITHETQVVTYRGPDLEHRGKEIAFNSNAKTGSAQDTFSIVDVTNKSAMTRLSTQFYPGARYIHQGWLTEDHRYFFQNDETDESGGVTGGRTRTHLWDLADLDSPHYKGYWDNDTTSIDHNLYVKDGYVFQTNYTTGLRVLKIGNLASDEPEDWLEEVAFFDTYPANDGKTFNGAWNNYPFFPSGNIAVSDIDGGLFVLRPNLPGWDLDPTKAGPRNFNNGALVPEPSLVGLMSVLAPVMLRRRRSPAPSPSGKGLG
jgi:choice-of-anchor B domain-containing protein